MIDITDSICKLLETIPELKGHVYRTWPQTKLRGTFATVFRISRQVESSAWDGSELVVRVSFSINLVTDTQERISALEESVTDLMASYNLHSTAAGPTLVDASNLYRQSIVVTGSVDRRGNTFYRSPRRGES